MTINTAAKRNDDSTIRACREEILDDRQWAVVAPFFPVPKGSGRRPIWPVRTILEAVLYLLRSGCQWRLLPPGYPPRTTVHRWLMTWIATGLIKRINRVLVGFDRRQAGRNTRPSAAVIDAQSVKTTETAGLCGYDGGKKINGVKRHILVDTDGRLLEADVTTADIHDSRGAVPLMRRASAAWPRLSMVFADAGYRGQTVAEAVPGLAVTVVTGPPNQNGFVVQKRRWVVERTIAWINRNRRLAKNYERLRVVAEAFITLAAAMILVRRIAKASTI